MGLQVHDVSLELITAIGPLHSAIRRRDRNLGEQLQRAASSIVLNLAEGAYSDGGNRRARFHTAAGSNHETRAALQVAIAWGYLTATEANRALELADRVQAMLWRLTRC